MTPRIRTGTILIHGKTILPETLLMESERVSQGWILAKNLDRANLERTVRDTGGSCVSLRQEFNAAVWGFGEDMTARKALRQVLQQMGSVTFNCLEVLTVDITQILGLLYVRVSARAWRIRDRSLHSKPSAV